MSRPNRPLFADVSVTVATGDRLGVVGINGTGKSTLLSVIAGTRPPESGQVRRGRGVVVAAVDQVTRLVGGTVRDAVGAGWRGEAAIHRLGLANVIDRRVDELSGGQEKRAALARALVADADLLILDEPTNHLDVDAIEWLEHELDRFRGGLVVVTHDRAALDRLSEGRTTIVIAHRLATVRNADTIFVMDKGQLVDQGTHEQLLARGGLYARLAELQFGAESDTAAVAD